MKQISLILLVTIAFSFMDAMAQETGLKLTINNETELTATLVDNSSVTALLSLLEDQPLTIEMSDYGNMEKVGMLGTTLPRNDEQITTAPGDLILYQGSAFVIYYAPNTWNFTRLGKINNTTQDELKAILGVGDVTVTLELTDIETGADHPYRDEDPVRVYPNPVRDYLEVSGRYRSMTLMDPHGRTLRRSIDRMMDVRDIASGIYFLKIETGNREVVMNKIIKN